MRPLIRVLEADRELAGRLPPAARAVARDQALAVVHEIHSPIWQPNEALDDEPGHLGLLVLEGVLIRNVSLTGVACTELVGPGDLIRPWDDAAPYAPVPVQSDWTVLEEARVAVLDRRFAAVISRWPELSAALVSRSVMRSLWLACLMGIGHLRRVDARVKTLLWLLAYRWGHVERDGVVVPLPLTHQLLGRLVGAERPSVTRALGTLAKQGLVARRGDGTWLLRGEAPDAVAPAAGGDRLDAAGASED